jgi:hypothetical protein
MSLEQTSRVVIPKSSMKNFISLGKYRFLKKKKKASHRQYYFLVCQFQCNLGSFVWTFLKKSYFIFEQLIKVYDYPI